LSRWNRHYTEIAEDYWNREYLDYPWNGTVIISKIIDDKTFEVEGKA